MAGLKKAVKAMVAASEKFIAECVEICNAAQLPQYKETVVVGCITTAELKQAQSIAPCRYDLDYVKQGAFSPAAWDADHNRNRDYAGAIKILKSYNPQGTILILAGRQKGNGSAGVAPDEALEFRAKNLSTLSFHAFTIPADKRK